MTVTDGERPDLTAVASWAHVQVVEQDPAAATARLRGDPSRWDVVRSRIVSPRKLAADHDYVACLVPVFKAGQLAALGQLPGPAGDDLVDLGRPVPVYDHWRFRTEQDDDFRTLALRLRKPLRPAQGRRLVAVDADASRLHRQGAAPLPPAEHFSSKVRPVPTAMAAGDATGPLTPGLTGDPQAPGLPRRLKRLLNAVAGAVTPVVGPPLWGRWFADATDLDGRPDLADVVPDGPHRWITDLNADPDVRIAAGLGARIVERDQEELIAEAWQQLDGVATANDRVTWAQVAVSSTERLHDRLAVDAASTVIRILQPALEDVPLPDPVIGADTFLELLEQEVPGAGAVLSPAYLRACQVASGPAADADAIAAPVLVAEALTALETGSPDTVPDRFVADPAIDVTALTAAVVDAGAVNVDVTMTVAGLVANLQQLPGTVAAAGEQLATLASPGAVLERLAAVATVQQTAFEQIGLAAPPVTTLVATMGEPIDAAPVAVVTRLVLRGA